MKKEKNYTIKMQTKQLPLAAELLKLTERPYDEYNAVLTEIMTRLPLDVQVQTFQRVLSEELPFQTARRAYRIAIRVAMGEEVDRERSKKPARKAKPVVANPPSTNTN